MGQGKEVKWSKIRGQKWYGQVNIGKSRLGGSSLKCCEEEKQVV